MDFSKEDLQYIKGEKFSNSYALNFKDGETKQLVQRINFIEELVKGKNILHLGCTDHLPLIEKKIASNNWLHKRITESSRSCVGIDINKEAIEYCHSLGFNNIIYCDIYKDKVPKEIAEQHFDLVIIGELLEHVDDPVSFLKKVTSFLQSNYSKLVITGPNALRWNNTKFNFQNKELINSDHRFWFTPYTLAKLLARAGLTPSEFWFCMVGGVSRRKPWLKWFLKKYPAFQDTIVITAIPS